MGTPLHPYPLASPDSAANLEMLLEVLVATLAAPQSAEHGPPTSVLKRSSRLATSSHEAVGEAGGVRRLLRALHVMWVDPRALPRRAALEHAGEALVSRLDDQAWEVSSRPPPPRRLI